MRALTLWQPWATLVAIGAKRAETRSWEPPADFWEPTGRYAVNGPPLLAIHAAKREPDAAMFTPPFRQVLLEHLGDGNAFYGLPTGAVIAVAEVEDVVKMREDPLDSVRPHHYIGGTWERAEHEAAFGDYRPGRYAWLLGHVWQLERPLPIRGRQRLWRLTEAEELEVRVRANLDTVPVRP